MIHQTARRHGATVTSEQYQSRKGKVVRDLRFLLADIPKPDWQPLRSFPAAIHPRQSELDAWRELGDALPFGRLVR